MKLLNKKTTFIAIALTVAATSGAQTGQVSTTGKTLASSKLATDVLNKIVEHNRTQNGCADVSAVRIEVLPRNYVPRQPAIAATSRGGHFERWSIDACGSQQKYQVGLWPAPKGGSDFAVTPLPGHIMVSPKVGIPGPETTVGDGNRRPAPAATSLAAWNGRYVWEESLGRIGGSTPAEGAAAFVTYTLAMGPGNGATGCTLKAQGFQTNMQMQCTATPQGSAVVVKFYKFGQDNGRGRHTMGERLLTLRPDASGGITTNLEGLKPASDATARNGRLFRKLA
ncbi:MAG: hypothetical protein EOP81_12300 [Variovorax sp.]|nr:MAG: hypothetical protein EOP81_12300 [Variovorax sp.]